MGLMGLIGLMGLMGLGLMGCSSGGGEDAAPFEEAEEPVKTIAFSSGLAGQGSVTRASGLEEDDVTSFTVWSFKNMSYDAGSYDGLQTVMNKYIVNWVENTAATTTSNTHDWEYVGQGAGGYQTIKFWDFSSKAYRFFAVTGDEGSDYVVNESHEPASVTLSFIGLDASDDSHIAAAPYYSKLWFSTGDPSVYPDKQFGQPVQLEFVKPFTRVRFMFTFADGFSFGRKELTGISFKPTDNSEIYTKGGVEITYPLTGTATKESWTSTPTDAETPLEAFTIDYYQADENYVPASEAADVYDNTPEKWYTVFPRVSQGSYTLSVVVVANPAKKAVVPAEYMTWLPGYDYTYRFKITESGGVVFEVMQVGISDWKETKIEHPFYNW